MEPLHGKSFTLLQHNGDLSLKYVHPDGRCGGVVDGSSGGAHAAVLGMGRSAEFRAREEAEAIRNPKPPAGEVWTRISDGEKGTPASGGARDAQRIHEEPASPEQSRHNAGASPFDSLSSLFDLLSFDQFLECHKDPLLPAAKARVLEAVAGELDYALRCDHISLGAAGALGGSDFYEEQLMRYLLDELVRTVYRLDIEKTHVRREPRRVQREGAVDLDLYRFLQEGSKETLGGILVEQD